MELIMILALGIAIGYFWKSTQEYQRGYKDGVGDTEHPLSS